MTKTKNRSDIDATRPNERRPSHGTLGQNAVREQTEQRLAELDPAVDVLAVEVASNSGAGTVRIFIDAPGGVTHALCVRVTRHLGDLLRDYAVEVSSPGPNRPLSKPEHFQRCVGQRVRVKTFDAIDRRNDFKADLTDADGERVTLTAAWGTVAIPYEQIRKANLIAQAGRKQ
jgi:ribosome maturation factor RimP